MTGIKFYINVSCGNSAPRNSKGTHFKYEKQKRMGEYARRAVIWFLNRYNLTNENSEIEKCILVRTFHPHYKFDWYGRSYEGNPENVNECDYMIDIIYEQNLRDFLATLFHECIHILQWERDHWRGEGELEANKYQYELADEYWKCGNLTW